MRISDWSSDVCSSDLVETHDDLALVRGLGCSHVQGYIYGRPMDLAEVLALLREGGGRAEAKGFKSTREPRLTVFRTIQIDSGGYRYEAIVRKDRKSTRLNSSH